MSTRSGRIRQSVREVSPPRLRKGVSPPRSPARTRKTSPSAGKTSPARGARKSPARKSPSRKTTSQFPARKSPSRTTAKDDPKIPKSPTKRPFVSSLEVKLEDFASKIDSYRNTRARRSEYSIRDIDQKEYPAIEKFNGVGNPNSNDLYGLRNRKLIEEVAPRRSSRLREFIDNVPDIRRSLSKSLSESIDESVSKSVSKSLDTYSEESAEDEVHKEKLKAATRKLATPLRDSGKISLSIGKREFGGNFGAATLIILIPLTVFSILLSCKKSCTLQSLLNVTVFGNISNWFSLNAVAIMSTQYILQAIFALLPIFGTKVQQPENEVTFHFNALFSSIITVNLLFGLEFLNVIDTGDVLKEYLRLAAVNYIFSVTLSIILFVKSQKIGKDQLNPYGNTGKVLYDFAIGKEIQPYFGKLNIKIWTSRISNITTLILAVLLFKQAIIFPGKHDPNLSVENLREFAGKIQLNVTVLLYSFLQIVYILNFIMKEFKIVSTFYWQSEGEGYLQLVASALYPFYFLTISKYISDSSLILPQNILILSSILFLVGFLIMVLSNNIKHEFRKNPMQPNLANLDSMPTLHGKKLLVSHLWGVVRHPNYSGDILIHIALALPGILTGKYVAALPALLTILVLLHRARRDHVRCAQRYGAAWQRYTRRVPSAIIPKIL